MRRGSLNYRGRNLQRIRRLRKQMSVTEEILWKIVRRNNLGFSFRRQHPVGPYVLDFYCSEAKLCVEMDGEQHDEQADAIRDRYLSRIGITTLRIPNLEFLESVPSWVEKIQLECIDRTGRLPRNREA